ncbi:hypothetical protein E1211_00685 [Micromonospora sp. 15K316]|uniref:hypothetical protein n=1 Tax=Micromonospora sp. 15K316 TaxID=2530376 RepID=UPI001051D68A|nr:hypothetical protein [Micromonospora sp. 15K316]TDC40658.1 hypothetical protein E1211_00685 [Micromonospora sp. 15K316]
MNRQDWPVYHEDLGSLERAPAQVRTDYLRIVERMMAEVPRRWVSRLSVPVLWLTLGSHGGDGIEVEPTDVYTLSRRHGYPDEFHRWVTSAVRSRVDETGARCAALVCHSGMGSTVQGPLLRALTGPPDREVHLYGAHRDHQRPFSDVFEIQRGPLRRPRFTHEVHQRLAEAGRAG